MGTPPSLNRGVNLMYLIPMSHYIEKYLVVRLRAEIRLTPGRALEENRSLSFDLLSAHLTSKQGNLLLVEVGVIETPAPGS